jgi:predicted dinucleotide-binding enzyme
MRIGILGTGAVAVGLGTAWARAGHGIRIGGRSRERALAAAARIGGDARAAEPREVVAGRDAVLLAVPWEGVPDALRAAGAADGTLAGVALIDPVNAVEHGAGVLLPPDGRAAAEHIAGLARGAHVVKGFHLFPAGQWQPGNPPVTVALAGDDASALDTVGALVRDAGAHPVTLGGLARARQLEEVAGFVIALAMSGTDPNAAVPRMPAPAGAAG